MIWLSSLVLDYQLPLTTMFQKSLKRSFDTIVGENILHDYTAR
jgi:hypothetical protein